MKRIRAAAGVLVLALILGACGGPVDETLLPTLVPTYEPERFLADAETMPSVAPETDEEVEEAEGDEVGIEEVEIDEADAEEPAAEDEADAPAVDDAAEDAADNEAADDDADVEASILPTPTPEATPVDEDDAVRDEATEDEALEDEAEIDAAAPATDEVEAAEETAVDETEDVDNGDTEADESEVDEAEIDEAEVDEAAGEEEVDDAGVADEEADEEELVDEALDEVEAVEEPETAIHPDWEGLPDEILAAMTTADPARGEQLSLAQGCIACHAMDPDQLMVGPTWHDMAGTARTRVEGESAGLYLYNSIIHPNDHIVEGYLPNIMLQIYEDVLNEQELADIITYLLTLEADD